MVRRLLVPVSLLALAACGKSAANQDTGASGAPAPSGPHKVAVPGGGFDPGAVKPADPKPAGADDRAKLKADEGTLAIAVPADLKAGAEGAVKITVTPKPGYHVNTEYPIHLALTPTDGVKLAKAEFDAGGGDKAKGDADQLDEQNLTLSVKLTPAAAGSYTLNGTFKFAVCDKDQCLPKKEQVAIAVAVK